MTRRMIKRPAASVASTRRRSGYPILSVRERGGQYFAGIAAEVAYVLVLYGLGFLLAVLVRVVFCS